MKSSTFVKYLANTSWMLFQHAFRVGLNFAVAVFVIRYLGPEDYGLFRYALSFVVIASALSQMGLEGIVTREVVREDEGHGALLGTAFSIRMIGSLLMLVLVTAASAWFNDGSFTTVLIVIIALRFPFECFTVIAFYFQGLVQSKRVVYAQLFQLLTTAGLKAALVYFSAPLLWFAVACVVESAVLAVGLIWVYHRQGRRIFRWRFSRSLARKLVKLAWPVLLSGVAATVYNRIDQIMIKQLLGVAAVGQYAAAVRISESLYAVTILTATSLFPAIVNAQTKSSAKYREHLQRYYDLLTWGSLLLALTFTVIAPPLIGILFGESFAVSASVLQIHVWSGVFVALGAASLRWLILEDLQKVALVRTLIGAVVNVVANLILIPRLGLSGAAVATVSSYAVANYLSHLFYGRLRQTFFMQTRALVVGWYGLLTSARTLISSLHAER